MEPIAARVAQGTPTPESLREILALTIAVVGATEQLYRAVGQQHPEQWESLEASEITGTRPFHRGTGHTQRPGRGPASAGGELGTLVRRPRRDQTYQASAPPPTIQGNRATTTPRRDRASAR